MFLTILLEREKNIRPADVVCACGMVENTEYLYKRSSRRGFFLLWSETKKGWRNCYERIRNTLSLIHPERDE